MNIDTHYLSCLSSLLLRLELCGIKDPLVAGGAIRDMLFEKPIKDIDVFYSEGEYAPKLYQYFNKIPTATHNAYEDPEWEVKCNLEDKQLFPGITIQLIKVKDVTKTIDNFPVDFCRVSFGCPDKNSDERLNIHLGVLQDMGKKKTWYNKGNCSEAYLERLQEKYDDWEFYY